MAYRRKHDRIRPRGWFSLFLRLGGWASLVFGVVLVILTGFSASSLFLADRLDRDGALAMAAVANKRIETGLDSEGHAQNRFIVEFTFKIHGGGGRTVETPVGEDYYDDVDVGSARRVRYLLADPGVIETDLGAYRRTGVILRNIGLGAGIAGLIALWIFGKRANRAIRTRRDGERRLAVVTGIRDVSVEVNGAPQGRLVWREPDGRTGESLMRAARDLRRLYGPGDEIVVFRLGADAFWEGDVGPPRREME